MAPGIQGKVLEAWCLLVKLACFPRRAVGLSLELTGHCLAQRDKSLDVEENRVWARRQWISAGREARKNRAREVCLEMC